MTTPPTRTGQDATGLLRTLTPREVQALAHLAAGHDVHRTAAALDITPATARNHLHRAMRKLGAATEADAVALAAHLRGTAAPEAEAAQPPRAQERPPVVGTKKHTPAADDPAAPQANPHPGEGGKTTPSDNHLPTPPGAANPRTTARQGDQPTAEPPLDQHREHSTTTGRRSDVSGGRDEAAARHDRLADTARAGSEHPAASPGPAAKPATAPAARRGDQRPAEPPLDERSASSGGPGEAAVRFREPTRRPAGTAPGQRRASDGRHDGPVSGRGKTADRHAEAAGRRSKRDGEPAPGTFEEVYEGAHARLVQQVFLLTACRHRALHCVRRAFGEARRGWKKVVGTGDPEGWVRGRACELALSPWHRGGPQRAHAWRLPHRRIKVQPADESQAVLPDHDRLTDRDRALLKALKRLSRPQRRALVLHDGLGLPAAAVAVEVESTLAAAERRVWAARTALARWVPDLVGSDPAAPGFADRLSGLLHRAAVRGCPEPHRPAVPVLRARHGLVSAARTGAAALLTAAVGGAVALTLAGGRPAALFQPSEPPEPPVCAAAPEAGVPVVPGGPPGGISSLWCSLTPGVEAVVVDPPPRAVGLWELPPAAGRGTEAPPPQGPPTCARWALPPCTPAR
ncbi:LuxR C-terminal-related transcriptional regulator [Kitasatospora aureofaciens]|uniref:LuxR C-terminal-related transcriptional regulator n=1 Tax=Kitasatospora aureofaciens TaxID=1894 RepID=UPI001C47557E|nr:LuxR C-terminal-related transcriptional regulator [Kitasatospora aureofaciens]MBV6696514.1 LuxR C-terminal-related transcriptional regulator [Kitasatospora aureofaciens]